MKTIKITADNEKSIIDIDFDNQEAVQEAVGETLEMLLEYFEFLKKTE